MWILYSTKFSRGKILANLVVRTRPRNLEWAWYGRIYVGTTNPRKFYARKLLFKWKLRNLLKIYLTKISLYGSYLPSCDFAWSYKPTAKDDIIGILLWMTMNDTATTSINVYCVTVSHISWQINLCSMTEKVLDNFQSIMMTGNPQRWLFTL